MQLFSTLVLLFTPIAFAQQYAGDIISADLPTLAGTEVAFFKIDDPSGKNNNLTLINYYSHGTDGNRIVESNIQRAVIVLHGLLRDPWNYENDVRLSYNSGHCKTHMLRRCSMPSPWSRTRTSTRIASL